MTLKELSGQYRQSSQLCRQRLLEIRTRINDERLCEMDRLLLRRRCTILESMMRETAAISKYLENYYGG